MLSGFSIVLGVAGFNLYHKIVISNWSLTLPQYSETKFTSFGKLFLASSCWVFNYLKLVSTDRHIHLKAQHYFFFPEIFIRKYVKSQWCNSKKNPNLSNGKCWDANVWKFFFIHDNHHSFPFSISLISRLVPTSWLVGFSVQSVESSNLQFWFWVELFSYLVTQFHHFWTLNSNSNSQH
jgi:hypothetical protein